MHFEDTRISVQLRQPSTEYNILFSANLQESVKLLCVRLWRVPLDAHFSDAFLAGYYLCCNRCPFSINERLSSCVHCMLATHTRGKCILQMTTIVQMVHTPKISFRFFGYSKTEDRFCFSTIFRCRWCSGRVGRVSPEKTCTAHSRLTRIEKK